MGRVKRNRLDFFTIFSLLPIAFQHHKEYNC